MMPFIKTQEQMRRLGVARLPGKLNFGQSLGEPRRTTPFTAEGCLLGERSSDSNGVSMAGMEPGSMQILGPGEDIKFSQPAVVGGSYSEFLRMQLRALTAAIGVTYEQLTGDLTQVNYTSNRAVCWNSGGVWSPYSKL